MEKDYTQLDELQGAGATLQQSSSIPGRYSFFWPEGVIGIGYGTDEIAIVNISNSRQPSVLSRQSIQSDGQYANFLLGINNGLAFFSIAYSGVEAVDISNPSSPRSLGLIKEYGRISSMNFAAGVAVTNKGIVDISDPVHPAVIEQVSASAVLGHGNSAVFVIAGSDQRIVSYLIDPKNKSSRKVVDHVGYGEDIFPMGEVGDDELEFATRYGSDLMVMALNGADATIRTIEDITCFGAKPIAAGDQKRVYASIGVPQYTLTFLSMISAEKADGLEPLWTIGLGTARLVRLKARESRVAFMTVPVDERGQSKMNPTVDIHVLDARSGGLPQYVGGLESSMFIPDFELVGDALYVMGKNGIVVYPFQ